ncbi:MAG: ATP-binding protein [Pseudomonadota bacterium]
MRIVFPPFWKQAPSVRASIAVLVIGCVLPLALVAAFLILHFYQSAHTQLISNMVSRARGLGSAVDRDFDSTVAAMQALGTSSQLMAGDFKGFHGHAVAVLAHLDVDSIVLVDPTGALLLSTRRPYGAVLPKLTGTPLLRRILKTGKPGVSDLFMGPLVKKFIYTIGVPIQRPDAAPLTLNATAMPAHLGALLVGQRLPPTWRASVFDTSGQLVVRNVDSDKWVGRKASDTLRASLARAEEGSFDSVSLDGVPVLAVYSRSAATGWTVALVIPLDELNAGLRDTLAWLIVATLAALAIGLALAWYIGGGIARSVVALVQPALDVGDGRAVAIPKLRFKEANALGCALQDAARMLQQARASTRESEQRLTLAASAAKLGIWVRDLVRHDIWVSKEWRELFGFAAPCDVTVEAMLARVHPDERAGVKLTIDLTLYEVRDYEMEFRILRPDGDWRWIASHGSVEADASGKPSLVRGLSFDITKRKLAELDAQEKQKEVMHLSRLAMLGELSGALAHELRQPLTAILSNAQAAQRFLGKPEVDLVELRAILQDIVDEDKRAGEIIMSLRRLFDKNDNVRERIDANELVTGVLRIVRNDLINHGVVLRTDLSADGVVLNANQIQMQQVLINLLMNACDAMAANQRATATVLVRTAITHQGELQISVIDSGSGIPVGALATIFDPFYTTKERGMGLGLSICRNIVNAYDGRLWAENNARQGATFHICLPLMKGPP